MILEKSDTKNLMVFFTVDCKPTGFKGKKLEKTKKLKAMEHYDGVNLQWEYYGAVLLQRKKLAFKFRNG